MGVQLGKDKQSSCGWKPKEHKAQLGVLRSQLVVLALAVAEGVAP
jgi:hypothetical protein